MSSDPSLGREWASELARSPDSGLARLTDHEVTDVLAPSPNPGWQVTRACWGSQPPIADGALI